MHLTSADRRRITGSYTVVREPDRPDVAAQSDPTVITTVSTMLSDIEAGGLDAVRSYAERLDGWTGGLDFEISADQVETLTAPLPADLKAALDKALTEIKADGSYAAIAQKYFGADVSQ